MDGPASRLAQSVLAEYLEDTATLALAFCHSHQLTGQDILRYEKLGQLWESPEDVGLPHSNLLELMKKNVSEQVWAESCLLVEEGWEAMLLQQSCNNERKEWAPFLRVKTSGSRGKLSQQQMLVALDVLLHTFAAAASNKGLRLMQERRASSRQVTTY